MDRVGNWPLIKRAWDAMVHGEGEKYKSAENYVKESYKSGLGDPEIIPAVLDGGDTKISDGDGIIFFNFRNDRMRQIVSSFLFSDFKEFNRGDVPKDLLIATMTDYDERFKVPVAYPPEVLANTLGEVVSKKGFKQLRVAEAEKQAHVTNFFNGGKLDPYPGEERIIVSSRVMKGKEYLDHPEMSAGKIKDTVIDSLNKNYELTVVNFANTDMVAHTGNIPAIKSALEVIDKDLQAIISAADPKKDLIIITADHGNAEELLDPKTGEPDTQHSTANVPIIFINDDYRHSSGLNLDNLYQLSPAGSLIDVAPTILNILGIKVPKDMSGAKIAIK
jgi:2,3-bisphosphoglycerate-independent phosphoglycerate mutase